MPFMAQLEEDTHQHLFHKPGCGRPSGGCVRHRDSFLRELGAGQLPLPSVGVHRHTCFQLVLHPGLYDLAVLVISIQRWQQVARWNTCQFMNATKLALVMIASAWGCSTVQLACIVIWASKERFPRCTLQFYLQDPHRITLSTFIPLAVAINVFFCLNLLRYAVKSRRAVHPHSQTADVLERARQRELRLHYTVIIIIAVLVFVWLPCTCLLYFGNNFKETLQTYDLVRLWGLLLVQLNSLVNPFIYTWRSKS